MYHYFPVEEKLKTEDGEEYISWGLKIVLRNDTEQTFIRYISDVSLNYEKLDAFSKLLTNNNIHPDHISEFIEDFIG